MSSIRVEHGPVIISWDAIAETRTVAGRTGASYLPADLLAATARALDAAGERNLSDAVAALVDPTR